MEGFSKNMGSQAVLINKLNQMTDEWWRSLPYEYDDLRVSIGSRPVGFRFSPHIVNIEADYQGARILTCGEANTPDVAMTKAIAELLERTAMKLWVEKNREIQIKSSNGWAAHESVSAAKQSAVLERVERDAVLAQWYTSTPFNQISFQSLPQRLRTWVNEELSQSELPIMKLLLSTEGLGPSVTCLFVNENGFGVSGHATKSELVESIESAIAETCRAAHHFIRRSFWAESLRLRNGDRSIRTQPGTHGVYYAYHEPFPSWMLGDENSWSAAQACWKKRVVDFTQKALPNFDFQTVLHDPLVIGFAEHREAFEISWGPTDTKTVLTTAANRRFASPITERTLNLKPHIVS